MMHNMSHHFKASNTPHKPHSFKSRIKPKVVSPALFLTKHPQFPKANCNIVSQEQISSTSRNESL